MIMVALLLAGCNALRNGARPATSDNPIATITPQAEVAHDFFLPALAGDKQKLSDLRGRWVVVNFWATWCAPCLQEMPYLQELADTHGDILTVLGINMREEPTQIAKFATDNGITFPLLLAPDDETLIAYNVIGLPATWLIAPDGTVVYKQFGALAPDEFNLLLPRMP